MKTLLFYPIQDKLGESFFFKAFPIPSCCVRKKDFSKMVLIEMLKEGLSAEEIWEKLQVSPDHVSEKRLIIDPHRMPGMRAVITYNSAAEAKSAVSRYHRPASLNTCAILVKDLLSNISETEQKIRLGSSIKEQSQIVYVDCFTEELNPAVFENFLTGLCASVSSTFSLCVNLNDEGFPTGEALVKFPFLSDAFAAELAFDEQLVNGIKLSVTTLRNVVLVQHDLKLRVSMIGLPEESISDDKLVPENYSDEFIPIGCSNLVCDFCYSTFVEIE